MFMACKFPFFIILVRANVGVKEENIIVGEPSETLMTVSLETPTFSSETPGFSSEI